MSKTRQSVASLLTKAISQMKVEIQICKELKTTIVNTINSSIRDTVEKKKRFDQQKKNRPRSKTAYILFNQEKGKEIRDQQDDLDVKEVMKMIGVEWKKLTKEEQQVYKDRATKQANDPQLKEEIKEWEEESFNLLVLCENEEVEEKEDVDKKRKKAEAEGEDGQQPKKKQK